MVDRNREAGERLVCDMQQHRLSSDLHRVPDTTAEGLQLGLENLMQPPRAPHMSETGRQFWVGASWLPASACSPWQWTPTVPRHSRIWLARALLQRILVLGSDGRAERGGVPADRKLGSTRSTTAC
jgi:hypothetical protein